MEQSIKDGKLTRGGVLRLFGLGAGAAVVTAAIQAVPLKAAPIEGEGVEDVKRQEKIRGFLKADAAKVIATNPGTEKLLDTIKQETSDPESFASYDRFNQAVLGVYEGQGGLVNIKASGEMGNTDFQEASLLDADANFYTLLTRRCLQKAVSENFLDNYVKDLNTDPNSFYGHSKWALVERDQKRKGGGRREYDLVIALDPGLANKVSVYRFGSLVEAIGSTDIDLDHIDKVGLADLVINKSETVAFEVPEAPVGMKTMQQNVEAILRQQRPGAQYFVEMAYRADHGDYNSIINKTDHEKSMEPVWFLDIKTKDGFMTGKFLTTVGDFIQTYLQRDEYKHNDDLERVVTPTMIYAALEFVNTVISYSDTIPLQGERFVSQDVLDKWVQFEKDHPDLMAQRDIEFRAYSQRADAVKRAEGLEKFKMSAPVTEKLGLMINGMPFEASYLDGDNSDRLIIYVPTPEKVNRNEMKKE